MKPDNFFVYFARLSHEAAAKYNGTHVKWDDLSMYDKHTMIVIVQAIFQSLSIADAQTGEPFVDPDWSPIEPQKEDVYVLTKNVFHNPKREKEIKKEITLH